MKQKVYNKMKIFWIFCSGKINMKTLLDLTLFTIDLKAQKNLFQNSTVRTFFCIKTDDCLSCS